MKCWLMWFESLLVFILFKFKITSQHLWNWVVFWKYRKVSKLQNIHLWMNYHFEDLISVFPRCWHNKCSKLIFDNTTILMQASVSVTPVNSHGNPELDVLNVTDMPYVSSAKPRICLLGYTAWEWMCRTGIYLPGSPWFTLFWSDGPLHLRAGVEAQVFIRHFITNFLKLCSGSIW